MKQPVSFVTGGSGFLGSHLIDALLDQGHEVFCFDDLSGGFARNNVDHINNKHFKFIQINLADPNNFRTIEEYFKEFSPDYVYHLSAYATEGLSHFIRLFNYQNNLIQSINLINNAVKYKVKRFIFTSSMGVYGTQPVPYTEALKPQPEDPYGTAKYAVEQDLHHAGKLLGLKYTIFRPHNIVGPRQHIGDTFRNVVGIFINQAMSGKPLTVFGDGSQVRAFSYVKDIVPYLVDCINNEQTIGEIYNVGGETPITIQTLAEKVIKYYGSGEIKYEEPRYEVHTAYSDHTKLYRDFGHLTENVRTIDDVLPEMIERAKTIGPQEPTYFNNIEINENIPPKRRPFIK